MRFLPVFLDVAADRIALFGAGEAARNKLRLLRAAGAYVRWYGGDADAAEETLLASAPPGSIEISFEDPAAVDLAQFVAVVSAIGDDGDAVIAARAGKANVPVNVVDRPDLSSFIFPAVVDRGDVVVAIGTGGASPVLARRLRERIEALLPARIGELADLIGRHRGAFAAARYPLTSARRFWERVIDGPIAATALAGRTREAEVALAHAIRNTSRRDGASHGTVFLVGAGPGDPDLLTLKALHALQNADIVFHDELVVPAILDRARRDAERVFVGKRRGHPGIGQDEINRRLLAAARQGQTVVRLKGGDPFVFGRGGEELEVLREAGIPVVVVPGVTAALGCAAEAGLPLTFRSEATRLTFVTAQRAGDAEPDWSQLTDPQSTLVVYMGLSSAASVRDGLIAAGRAPATPAGVLARGTLPDSKTIVGRLDELPRLAAQAGEGPALLVIGDAVARSDAWRATAETNEVAA